MEWSPVSMDAGEVIVCGFLLLYTAAVAPVQVSHTLTHARTHTARRVSLTLTRSFPHSRTAPSCTPLPPNATPARNHSLPGAYALPRATATSRTHSRAHLPRAYALPHANSHTLACSCHSIPHVLTHSALLAHSPTNLIHPSATRFTGTIPGHSPPASHGCPTHAHSIPCTQHPTPWSSLSRS